MSEAPSIPNVDANLPAMTAAQLRAARGFLNWPRKQLALAAGVSAETIKNIEHGIFVPNEGTQRKVYYAFSSCGVEFFTINSLNAYGVILAAPKTEVSLLSDRGLS